MACGDWNSCSSSLLVVCRIVGFQEGRKCVGERVRSNESLTLSSLLSLSIQKCFLFWLSEEQEFHWGNGVGKGETGLKVLFLQHALDRSSFFLGWYLNKIFVLVKIKIL